MAKSESPFIQEEHIHENQNVYPTGAVGVTLIAGAGVPWTVGGIVEIIPVGIITKIFDIHWVNIERLSVNAVYEGIIYKGSGGTEVEIGRFRVTRSATQNAQSQVKMMTVRQLVGERISGELMTDTGNADQLDLSLVYHTY